MTMGMRSEGYSKNICCGELSREGEGKKLISDASNISDILALPHRDIICHQMKDESGLNMFFTAAGTEER